MLTRFAFIALGSNLGDSRALLGRAVTELASWSPEPLLRSSLWRSTPVDCPPGSPLFLNAVVGLVPAESETPESLLERLQSMERDFGRRPKVLLNEPRPLDLDLITFRQERRDTPALVLPHPRAHVRRFVLQPLAEIASGLVLGGQDRTVAQLLGALRTEERLERLG